MRVVLLSVAATLAAITLPASPAGAQSGAAAGFSGGHAPSSGHFIGSPSFRDRFRHDRFRHDRRRNRGFDSAVYFGDREYQGDTLWRAESFNDWWHERPNRSYPAWVTRNQNCERQWWSGDSLRC